MKNDRLDMSQKIDYFKCPICYNSVPLTPLHKYDGKLYYNCNDGGCGTMYWIDHLHFKREYRFKYYKRPECCDE